MHDKVTELLDRIRLLQEELEAEMELRRAQFHYAIERRRVRFEQQVIAAHRRFKISLPRFLVQARLRNYILAPVIYLMVFPLAGLDLTLALYQWIYFGAYNIRKVKRSDFIVIDRHHLAYLNGIEKINCLFCSYANGLFALAREVGGRTEQYWCPIKHARRAQDPHGHYPSFLEYGDAESYRRELARLREALSK